MFELFTKILNAIHQDKEKSTFESFCQGIEREKFISLSFDETKDTSFIKEMICQWQQQKENPFPENFSFSRFNFCIQPILNENNKLVAYEMRFFFELNIDETRVHYYIKYNIPTDNYIKNKYNSVSDSSYAELMKIYLTGYGKEREEQEVFLDNFKKRIS